MKRRKGRMILLENAKFVFDLCVDILWAIFLNIDFISYMGDEFSVRVISKVSLCNSYDLLYPLDERVAIKLCLILFLIEPVVFGEDMFLNIPEAIFSSKIHEKMIFFK